MTNFNGGPGYPSFLTFTQNFGYLQYAPKDDGTYGYKSITTPIPDPSLPQNQAYAACLLDCQPSATPCRVVRRSRLGIRGLRVIMRWGATLNSISVAGMIPDPSITSNAIHGGPSWYDWSLIGTGHVATTPTGAVESYFDTFSPILLTPRHFLFDALPSFFINPKPGVPGPTYTCSPGVGCH